jgi:hypothetical protein
MKDQGIQKYLDALETGDSALLEELAIKVGYTERYEGPPHFQEYKNQLKEKCLYVQGMIQDGTDVSVDEFRDLLAFEKRIAHQYFGKGFDENHIFGGKWVLSVFSRGILSENGRSNATPFLERSEYILRRIDEISANEQFGFIRFRKGPTPFKHSFVSFLDRGLDSRYAADRPPSGQFFIDVYNEDPVLEYKLDHGVWLAKMNMDADVEDARSSASDVRNISRMMADVFTLDFEAENQIYGKKAVKHLYELSQRQKSDIFPDHTQYRVLTELSYNESR